MTRTLKYNIPNIIDTFARVEHVLETLIYQSRPQLDVSE